MERHQTIVLVILIVTPFSTSLPQQISIDKKTLQKRQASLQQLEHNNHDVMKLFESETWKKLLEQGKVGAAVVDSIQRALDSNKTVEARTQWGDGFQDKGELRNTVRWSAWKDNKTSLNLIVDSKVAKRNGKIGVTGPNFGLTFQIRY